MSRWKDYYDDRRRSEDDRRWNGEGSGRRREGYHQRSEDWSSKQNQQGVRSCSSGKPWIGSRNQMVGRFGHGKLRTEYSIRGEVRAPKREVDRNERLNEHGRRRDRNENVKHEFHHDRRRNEKEESRKRLSEKLRKERNTKDRRKEENYQNTRELRILEDKRRNDFRDLNSGEVGRNAGEVGRNASLAGPSEDLGERMNTPEKKSSAADNIQGLIVSIINKTKQMDKNGNVEWDQDVLNDIQDILNDNPVEETSFKDYSCQESSGLLSSTSYVKDERHKQDSELVKRCDGYSRRRKLVPGTSRKHAVAITSESRHISQKRSVSTEGPNISDCRNDEEDIDDDYMISIMKDVLSQSDKGKQAVKQIAPGSEFLGSDDSAEEAELIKAPKTCSSSSRQTNSRPSKTAPDSNLPPKIKVEADMENTRGNYVEGIPFTSLGCLPSPRPASATVHHAPGVGPEAVSGCPSMHGIEEEQKQSEGTKESPGGVCSATLAQRPEAEQCQPLPAEVRLSLPHNVPTETELIAIPEENKVSKVLTRKKIIFVDAENEIPEVKKEEKYEEPSPDIFDHVDLRANTIFTPITQRMHQVITSAMLSISEVILSRHNIDITKHDLFTLTGDNWLNDQVVEMFLAMIAQRSVSLNYVLKHHPRVHSMSTYFFTNLYTRGYSAVKKWTKEVDIFTFDLVLVPIHMDSHWSLASIDFRVPGVFYYDSLGSSVNDNSILSALLHYLSKEHMDKKGEEINLSMFAKQAMDTPLQQNGSDCGVFCCKVGDYLSRDIQIDFSQEDVKYFRKRMIFEILRGVLLEP